MKCDTLMSMGQILRKPVWELNKWFYAYYGTGLEEDQAQVILGEDEEEFFCMLMDMQDRMIAPEELIEEVRAAWVVVQKFKAH